MERTPSKSKFVNEYYLRLPFALDGAARRVCHLGTWEVLVEILRQREAEGVEFIFGVPREEDLDLAELPLIESSAG